MPLGMGILWRIRSNPSWLFISGHSIHPSHQFNECLLNNSIMLNIKKSSSCLCLDGLVEEVDLRADIHRQLFCGSRKKSQSLRELG